MKLGFIAGPKSVNSTYRIAGPMRALERRGHEVLWPSSLEEDVPLRQLLTCDLVQCFRRLDRIDDLEELSRRGVAVSYDDDRHLTAAHPKKVNQKLPGGNGRPNGTSTLADIVRMARWLDLATTPSQALGAKYRAAGARHVSVIENYLDPDAPGLGSVSERDGLVIGWIADREHEADLQRIPIVETLGRLLDRHPQLRVLSVGARLPLRSERYEHRKWVEFDRLLRVTGSIDIGIAPLVDNSLNRARSNIKLKEYSAGGAAWLASPVGAYREMARGSGGLLVADGDWFEVLDRLLRSGLRRRRLSRQALRWARTQTLEQFACSWETAFALAVDRARRRAADSTRPATGTL
jgi:hypothetical protein